MKALWPNKAPAPNRRPRFLLGGSGCFDYSFCAPPASPAAVGEARRWLGRRGLTVKLASLLLVGCWFAAAGCNSGRNQERQAVSDVEKVVAFYLPRLLKDPTLTSDKVFGPSRAPPPLVSQERQRELAQRLSRSRDQYVENLRSLGKQEFHGLTGQGYSGPGAWNTGGDYYLDARRNAAFGQTTFTISLLVMHPDTFAGYKDWGVEIVNDPHETGVEAVGKLKFLLDGMGLVVMDARQQDGLKAVGEPQFDIRGRLRVFVSHSGVRK
jgi:hypothetical protein